MIARPDPASRRATQILKKIIVLTLLVCAGFARAQDGKTAAAGAKPQNAQAEVNKKTDVYKTLANELLKNCEGTDKKIAVAGFSYTDGRDSRDGGVIAERITTELVKLKKFKIIERKEIERVFDELKLQLSGAIGSDSIKDIGKMLGADWIVLGTLTELPDKRIELNARLVGVESGEIINAYGGQVKKDWLNQYKKLLDDQNKIIEQNAKDAKAFYERGRTNLDLAKYDEAIANFGIAIELDPKFVEAYHHRGFAYLRKGKYDKAIGDYNKTIAIDPKNALSYINRGAAFLGKDEYDKAIEDHDKAIAIDPKNVYGYSGRGLAYAGKGEYDKAIEDCSKAIAIDPEDAKAYLLRGLAYYGKGEHDKAQNDWNIGVKLAPEFQSEIDGLKKHYLQRK